MLRYSIKNEYLTTGEWWEISKILPIHRPGRPICYDVEDLEDNKCLVVRDSTCLVFYDCACLVSQDCACLGSMHITCLGSRSSAPDGRYVLREFV